MLQFRTRAGEILAMTSAIAVLMAFSACTKVENKESASTAAATANTAAAPQQAKDANAPQEKDVTELKIVDLKTGSGDTAEAGKMVKVHYTGWLTDGKKFDSSVDRGDPFKFPLGSGSVIAGWDKGVAGMKVGGKRRLVIPPQMGYGAAGAGGVIPPNATLVFEVELLGVEKL
jgi:FKBP-type peptidyl-prolyl cis-trans isomerase